MKNYLTVGELRSFLQTTIEPCDIPDDAPIAVLGSDHSYRLIDEPTIEDAEGSPEKDNLIEASEPEAATCKVLVFGR